MMNRQIASKLFTAALVASVVFAAGCSKRGVNISVKGENGEQVQIKTDGRGTNITVEGKDATAEFKAGKDGGKLEVRDEKGNLTVVETNEADLKALGALAYPGAKVVTGGSVTSHGENKGAYKGATLSTSDSIEKVGKYYRDVLKNANVVDMTATQKTIIFTSEEDKMMKSVSVTQDSNDATKTLITVGIMQK
jgi:hypothetical protein